MFFFGYITNMNSILFFIRRCLFNLFVFNEMKIFTFVICFLFLLARCFVPVLPCRIMLPEFFHCYSLFIFCCNLVLLYDTSVSYKEAITLVWYHNSCFKLLKTNTPNNHSIINWSDYGKYIFHINFEIEWTLLAQNKKFFKMI